MAPSEEDVRAIQAELLREMLRGNPNNEEVAGALPVWITPERLDEMEANNDLSAGELEALRAHLRNVPDSLREVLGTWEAYAVFAGAMTLQFFVGSNLPKTLVITFGIGVVSYGIVWVSREVERLVRRIQGRRRRANR